MNLKNLKIIALMAIMAIVSVNATASDDENMNCFAVIAGRNTTIDGSVMMAHNEDDAGEQMLNVYQVPRGSVGDNVKYTWFEFPGLKVADAFINEYGVACASNSCRSREDRSDLTDGGVLYEVRTLIGQKARSAREAVKLVGDLVMARGYSDSGRTYVVADCNEGWIISLVKGRHWVAQRIPDDKVMLLPNNYIIDQVDLSDTENFAGSPDLIEYAKERGWWNPADGPFSFKKAYTDHETYVKPINVLRHQQALQIITGKEYPANPDELDLFVTPKKKVDKELIMEVLRGHYGESEKPGEHPMGICRSVNILALLFQLRSNLPVEIGAMAWVAAGHPCIEAFLPWYSGMTQSPEGFCRYSTPLEAIERHLSDVDEMHKNYPSHVAWLFVDRWNSVNANYVNLIDDISRNNAGFQKKWFDKQLEFEQSLKAYYTDGQVTNRPALEKALNAFTAEAYKDYFSIIKTNK